MLFHQIPTVIKLITHSKKNMVHIKLMCMGCLDQLNKLPIPCMIVLSIFRVITVTINIYVEIFTRTKFSPISLMHAVGENFFREFFCTVKSLACDREHTCSGVARGGAQGARAPPLCSWPSYHSP